MNRTAVILLVVALAASLAAHVFFGTRLGIACLIFFVGWPLGGTLVTIDDDLKGGWSNPDGTVRPPWVQMPFWGQIVGGFAIASIGFAIDAGWNSRGSIGYWLAGAFGLAIAFSMIKIALRAKNT